MFPSTLLTIAVARGEPAKNPKLLNLLVVKACLISGVAGEKVWSYSGFLTVFSSNKAGLKASLVADMAESCVLIASSSDCGNTGAVKGFGISLASFSSFHVSGSNCTTIYSL